MREVGIRGRQRNDSEHDCCQDVHHKPPMGDNVCLVYFLTGPRPNGGAVRFQNMRTQRESVWRSRERAERASALDSAGFAAYFERDFVQLAILLCACAV